LGQRHHTSLYCSCFSSSEEQQQEQQQPTTNNSNQQPTTAAATTTTTTTTTTRRRPRPRTNSLGTPSDGGSMLFFPQAQKMGSWMTTRHLRKKYRTQWQFTKLKNGKNPQMQILE